jgi:hypothetical protein
MQAALHGGFLAGAAASVKRKAQLFQSHPSHCVPLLELY